MSTSKRTLLLLPLLAALAAAPVDARNVVTDPSAPRALPAEGPVRVEWTDPAQFSDILYSHNRWEAEQGNWVVQLAEHLQQRAETRLPEGRKMEVTITDIRRAGSYEPQLGPNYDHVRVLRDIYPPRMTLQLRITDADGRVVAEGERKLADLNYLHNGQQLRNDPLRHEKRMIDEWLRRELSGDGGLAAK